MRVRRAPPGRRSAWWPAPRPGGDGEILAAAMGTCSILGARLARLTFEPGLLTTDGGALLTAEPVPIGAPAGPAEGGCPSATTCGWCRTGDGT
nr:hypothetical protein GCM10020093_012580 [Planobispora longispora]